MELKEFIVTVLSHIDGTQLQGGNINFDIAVWPDGKKIWVVSAHNADQGLSRIRFDVGTKKKESEQVNGEDR